MKNLINCLKENYIVIASMGSAILVTLIISLFFNLSFNNEAGLQIIFILVFAILFIALPVFFVLLCIEDKINRK